ncbi:PAX-interacting protein 1 [Cinnamomum micranthum f. kanehirae]|uniref:PAX-interacting protein 1 n=1 Tax=Cinnamomum micranthum f. kanehirae TaxID=337451 RepID=A0A443N899_9MAGN|nr:PAX-interacting protein 1 [Cinnamomum micranthum f. kanehirae]
MARRKRSSSSTSASSSHLIGNCKVEIEGSDFFSESTANSLLISVPNIGKVKISVNASTRYPKRKSRNDHLLNYISEESGERQSHFEDHSFLLLNPKDIDSRSKLLLQKVLKLYMKELPEMNYAANTGKESLFLERCVSSGKYRTLLLTSNATEGSSEVIAAVSYQIIPADTQYAEIPVAAVCSNFQNKGIGRHLYEELRKRLQNVGVLTIFCWGDKESEGFWLKQGFVSVAEVDTKGRARKLPIKADIRRALCFPGGSTLMVSHLNKDASVPVNPSKQRKCSSKALPMPSLPVPINNQVEARENYVSIKTDKDVLKSTSEQTENLQPEALGKDGHSMNEEKVNDSLIIDKTWDHGDLNPRNEEDLSKTTIDLGLKKNERDADGTYCSSSARRVKKRVWESSRSSLKSKKVKGGLDIDCNPESSWNLIQENNERNDVDFDDCSLSISKDWSSLEVTSKDQLRLCGPASNAEDDTQVHLKSTNELTHKGKPVIMLMNIADDTKKECLIKIVEDLGGAVTSHGSATTHVITGKARRTLNFCTALCSGAWILSPNWLKASFRDGNFRELPFILEDEEYKLKYKSELKYVVLKARASPGALLKGYDICIAKHIQPPLEILSTIIKSAGGNVLNRLDKMQEPSRTIFLACEENMDVALGAAKRGIRTYSSDWFMSCVMRQELDFEAPQFAESL